MKTTIVIATALIFSLTMNVNAQNKASKNEVKVEKKEKKVKKEKKQKKVKKEAANKNEEKTNNGNAYGKNKGDLKGKEFGQDRAANAKIQAKKDKEEVENNIQTMVEEIKKEEKNLEEIQAQKNDPANNDNKVDEAIKNSENKINEMTEKLKKENNKLKELQKIIDSNE